MNPLSLRNGLRWGVAAIALIALGGAVAWSVHYLMDPRVLPIEVVEIQGEFRNVTRESLQSATAPYAAGGFFTVDMDAVRNAAEALPWVSTVRMRRVWPSALHIDVVEHEALARWGDDALVSVQARLFYPAPATIDRQLPRLQADDDLVETVVARFHAWQDQFAPTGMRIASLRRDRRGAWDLEMDSGLALRLGREGIDARIERFVSVYTALSPQQRERFVRVDLRYANGFAVHRRNDVSEEEGAA